MQEVESRVVVNLERLLKERHLKKKDFALMIGLTKNQLSATLKGRRAIKDDTIVQICQAINITPNDLFGYTKKNAPSIKLLIDGTLIYESII